MTPKTLTIGELATRAAVTPDTLRYYERLGLLPPPARTPGGYRVYDSGTVERVGVIRKAQALGLTLDEVREILRIAAQGTPPCEHVRTTLKRRVKEIDARIAELASLRGVLAKALARTRSLPLVGACVCGIIERHDLATTGDVSRLRGRLSAREHGTAFRRRRKEGKHA